MSLTLIDKLNTINKPPITSYSRDTAKTIEEFWDKFVTPHLPKTPQEIKVYTEWFELLLKYCNDPEAVFAIRCFSTPSGGSKNYITFRRGFFTKTNYEYSFFYTDNYFAAYFLKMATDGFVPDYDMFKGCMLSREFPARFGPYDSKYEKVKAAYSINGKDPGFTINGYKIAHIVDTGMNYNINNKKIGLAEICQKYFPRGKYSQWKLEKDKYGEYYVRHLTDLDNQAKKILKAHFLRFACPLNYVLTPKKSCHICHKSGVKDIAEYPPFQQYAQEKFLELFGDSYKKYLNELMCYEKKATNNTGNVIINIEYDLLMSGTDELSDFAKYVVDVCNNKHSTANSYKHSIRAIMQDLNITNISDLDGRIKEAIDHCDAEISKANICGDKSKKKNYSDYRSAMKKYKLYAESKN